MVSLTMMTLSARVQNLLQYYNLILVKLHLEKMKFSPPSFQAPRKHKEAENGTVDAESSSKSKECNGAPLLSECALQEVRDDLQLHLCLSALFTLPVMLIAPSLIHWIRNLRYRIKMEGVCERAHETQSTCTAKCKTRKAMFIRKYANYHPMFQYAN